MRIRYPFAGAFLFLLILAAYIGLLPHSTSSSIPSNLQPNDKFLHVVTFFFLSLVFYWIPDTTRRRSLQLTLLICTLALGIGSEIVQAILPNDRPFDPFDILANLVGSLGAVGLCSWYHRRMLERRRKARFGALSDERGDDIELGGAGGSESGLGPQESGVMSLEQEVDNWDENAVDTWDTEEGADEYSASAAPGRGPESKVSHVNSEGAKRID
ncbi:hypothetical protein KXW75_004374 [Aspergillus fumigatus]|nr:hypothetical protein KXX58_009141 [Aspergillus fumigatus]KAH1844981.1 hypothetical protein KXX54_009710 [Aspergillus fumigatus]KAH1882543.1 hypothetical protein KXX01_002884 [Aspergillus fumigatus]KAH2018745.1 hypothetical protein KXV45_004246 [Aspergillus fumigatus]KAH2029686.1 hypothetical protein KXV65_004231 [Aspergillus fumigatus]